MRTHSTRIYAPVLSILALLMVAAPAAAATAQQASGRRDTPGWIWLLLLLAIALLVWWLWNSSRHKAEVKQSAATQAKLPESIGDAVDRDPGEARTAAPAMKPAAPAAAAASAGAANKSEKSAGETIIAEEVVAEEIVVENVRPTPGVALAGEKLQPAAAPEAPPPAKPVADAPAPPPAAQRSVPAVDALAATPAAAPEVPPPAKPVADEPAAPPAAQRSAPVVDALAATPAAAPEAPPPAKAVTDEPAAPPAAKPKRAKSAKAGSDDLTVIEGIGPKISAILQAAGITTYAALAAASVDDLRALLTDNNLRFADPTTWPEQAALAGTAPEKLAELKATLKGGRRQ